MPVHSTMVSAELTSLVTIEEHVPRVILAFSSVRPFLTTRIPVAAILTKATSLWTVRNHPFAVFAATSFRRILITT